MKRRNFIKTMSIASAILMLPEPSKSNEENEVNIASPNAMSLEQAIDRITYDLPLEYIEESDRVILRIPEIAENPAVVPVKVEVDYPMEKDDYVQSIHILTSENSNARAIDVFLTPTNGKAMASTRIKIKEIQETQQKVIVIVGLSNGSFLRKTGSVQFIIPEC